MNNIALPIDTASIVICDPCYLISVARDLGVDEKIANTLVQRVCTSGRGLAISLGADGQVNVRCDEHRIVIEPEPDMEVTAQDWVFDFRTPTSDENKKWREARVIAA